jgi:iron complex transport system substrate-binding protein
MGAGELISALGVNNPGTINSWSELFYPGAGEIPSMGGTTPAIEELMNMDPDLVIVHPATVKDGFAQQIRDAGIPAININFSTYDDMMISYSMLGTVLGGVYQERLDTWCDMVSEKQEEVNAITEKLTDEEKPVVYYIAGQSDSLTTTMGMNSICADWTALAGGTYAMSLMDEPNATEVTAEEIFAIDPDVIIVGGTYQHKLVEELENTDGWKDLSAVVNNRVYTNPYGAFSWDRFGLESYLQMDYALMCIQPELAEASDVTRDSIIDEVIDFYKIMNGTELTKEQAGNMLDGIEPDGTEVDPDAAGAGMGGGRG